MQDHFGFPINVHPFSAVGTSEKLEIAEVLNQMVRKACVFERPKTVPTTTTTTTATTTTTEATTATAHRKVKSMPKNEASVEVIEKKVDQVLAQTVATETAYSSLVSINK